MNKQNIDEYMNKPNIVRYDRNVSNNLTDFKNAFGEYSILAQDLMIYLAFKVQSQNLFRQIELDPAEFGKIFSYSKPHLDQHIKIEEKQYGMITVLDHQKKHQMKRLIEHVLYLLASRNIQFSGKAYITDQNERRTDIEFLQIITKISVIEKITDPRMTQKLNTKRKYLIELNKETITSFINWYIPVKLESLPQLRKPQIYNLYIYLKHLQAFNNPQYQIDFEKISEMAEVQGRKNIPERKTKITKKLKLINDITELKFIFKWTKALNHKHNYKLLIIFAPHDGSITETIQAQNKTWMINLVTEEILKEHQKSKLSILNFLNLKENQLVFEEIYRKQYKLLFSDRFFSENKMKSLIYEIKTRLSPGPNTNQ
jgi:hypothetical protein